MRVLFIAVVIVAFASVSRAAVEGVSGAVVVIEAPASTADDNPGYETTNDNMAVFNERQGVTLPQAVECTKNGASVTLPPGLQVDSHMVILNNAGSSLSEAQGTITFTGEILCVMGDYDGNQEAATSSFLGAENTFYPGAFAARGHEEDGDTRSMTGNTLEILMRVTEPGDWLRVVTVHEELIEDDCPEFYRDYVPLTSSGTQTVEQACSETKCVGLHVVPTCDSNDEPTCVSDPPLICDDLIICEDQTVHTWLETNPSGYKNPPTGGIPERFEATYNEATHEFTLDATFSPYVDNGNSYDTNSFWAVFSDSRNPKGTGNELVIFYADWATSQAALYVYSGENNANSWKAAWAGRHHFGTIPITTSTSGAERTFSISVEGALADDIANHSLPDWQGLQFGNHPTQPNQIGIWLHNARGGITFDGDGMITAYNHGQQTWYDKSSRPTSSGNACV